ncbi:MAG: signal peptidase I [Clostridia bacterium]|nr:signal peptidase I [Clostridia bacterium]MBQ8165084.1 signal peptidase I [Clostridia bacterium]
MRKKDKYEFYDDDEDDVEPLYDFSTVKLHGEGHVQGFYDDIESFSFDDDSYGELPFEDDEELVEEDFSLKSVSEDDDKINMDFIDDTKDNAENSFINDDMFDFGKPDDRLEDSEKISDDGSDDSEDNTNSNVPADDVRAKNSEEQPQTQKIRASALQPLLVINRSKHLSKSKKKEQKQNNAETIALKETEGFDRFDDSVFVSCDDDIEDMSDALNIKSDEISENTTEGDVVTPDENISEEISEELCENEESAAVCAAEDNSVTGEEVTEYVEAPDTVAEELHGVDDDSVEKIEEISDYEQSVTENTVSENSDIDEETEALSAVISDADKSVEDGSIEIAAVSDTDDGAEDASSQKDINTSEAEKKAEEKKLLKKKKKRKKMVKNFIREIISWIMLVLAAFAIAIVVNLYVARPSIVSGSSMMPTLNNGDTIVISKIPYMLGDVEYGDIVVIDRQANRDRTFIVELTESLKYNALTQSLFDKNELTDDTFWVKRVIGKPGDVIEFKDGKVYRNGEMLIEDYILTQEVDNYTDGQQVVVKEGCMFVMGDNRNASLDSRALAMHDEQIEIDHIVGKLISK